MNNLKRVIVGLSGGVDSSVSAYLLQQQGYEVIGIFMKNWHDTSVTISQECPWLEDSNDALLVAEKLGIPFQTVDLSEQYQKRIVDYMFNEYENGRTPNPDVLCNREIKFDVFLDIALSLGADYVATGHYCQKETIQKDSKEYYNLVAGADQNKDQSYFLCQLSQYQLSKALFPIGHLEKSQVRQIAKEQDLITADKKDSQGLCFIGKVKLPEFLQQQLKAKEGKVIEIPQDHHLFEKYTELHQQFDPVSPSQDILEALSKAFLYQSTDGKEVGVHQGAHFLTIGQRKGLGIGGTKYPLFVMATDVKQNIVYTGQGKGHRGLYRHCLFVRNQEVHWVREDLAIAIGDCLEVQARIRYRQPLDKAIVYRFEKGYYVYFKEPQSAITSGQFVAWYLEGKVIGSGVIAE